MQANAVQEVAPGLRVWSYEDPQVKCLLSCTAYRQGDSWWLIDPLALGPAVWGQTFSSEKVSGIFLTNANHARASLFYRDQFGCDLWASAETQEHIEIEVDHSLSEGQVCGGLKVRLIPGGGPGETAFLAPEGYLILGDAVINLRSTGLALLPDKYCANAERNRESLRFLLAENFHLVTFAHGNPLRDRARDQLADLLG
jgi:Metallo-beta-lactamase superfamily